MGERLSCQAGNLEPHRVAETRCKGNAGKVWGIIAGGGMGLPASLLLSFFPEARSAIRDRRETHRLPEGFVGPGSPPRFCGAAAGRNVFWFERAVFWRGLLAKRELIPAVHPFPSPLGEDGRRPDEGGFSCYHSDLPLTLTLSPGRGKAFRAKKIKKLIRPLFTRPIIPSFPRHLRPGLVIRGRGEDGARPVGWS